MEKDEIPYGYCQCGCGEKAPIATRNRKSIGNVKGQPQRYIQNHCQRMRRGGFPPNVIVDAEDRERFGHYTWLINVSGYVVTRCHDGKMRRLHRMIVDAPEHLSVDHINRNKLDNRRFNLRLVEPWMNSQNKPAESTRTKSGYRGVSWVESLRRWMAAAELNGKSHNVGTYLTKEDAVAAIRLWRKRNMPYSVDDIDFNAPAPKRPGQGRGKRSKPSPPEK